MSLSLKAARVNSGLNRPEVIHKLENEHGIKITVNTLANYENRKSTPDINTGKALASIYGMSVDDIKFF